MGTGPIFAFKTIQVIFRQFSVENMLLDLVQNPGSNVMDPGIWTSALIPFSRYLVMCQKKG